MKFKILIILILSSVFIFCKQKSKINKSNLHGCYKANIYKVTGNNRFISFNDDIEIFFSISKNKEDFRGRFIIDTYFFAENYVPFKEGDIVILKVVDNNSSSEIFLLKRPVTDWEAIYTLKDICNGEFSKEISHNKAVFSRGVVKMITSF
ncbi:hypothetical protein [Zunongwangia sp.]|uniref:hypothetical protein n=1 Tax=Zunongwangia sp. TaxID=1965325 RepID=UPI003AA832A6